MIKKWQRIGKRLEKRGVVLRDGGDEGLGGEESLFRGVESLIKLAIN